MIEFFNRDDLVFTKADKGGAAIILDVENYIQKAKELNNENYQKKLNHDPIKEHIKVINATTETFQRQQVLPKKVCDNLKTTKIRTQHFYITSKVYKKDIPGRPVVSSTDCHTNKICKFVDHYLKSHAKALPSHVQDKTNFINKLETVKDKLKDSTLVTLDVGTLYTNFSNHEGIKVVKETLNNQTSKSIATQEFLYLILTLNNLIFNGISDQSLCNGYNMCSCICQHFLGKI